MKVQGAVVVTLTSVSAWASHFKGLCQIFFFCLVGQDADRQAIRGQVLLLVNCKKNFLSL